MNLIIDNPDSLPLTEFCYWLFPYMRQYIINHIDNRRLKRWDEFLNSNLSIKRRYQILNPISSRDILIASTNNLRVRNLKDRFIIDINPVVFIPNTEAKFINIIQLINYGNLTTQAYNLYSEMMTYFANNIDIYYNQYLEEA